MERDRSDDREDRGEVDIDADGVDRAQIRAMLALSPEERLKRVEGFMTSVIEIRNLNASGPLR